MGQVGGTIGLLNANIRSVFLMRCETKKYSVLPAE